MTDGALLLRAAAGGVMAVSARPVAAVVLRVATVATVAIGHLEPRGLPCGRQPCLEVARVRPRSGAVPVPHSACVTDETATHSLTRGMRPYHTATTGQCCLTHPMTRFLPSLLAVLMGSW
jgi:hypothetical protein